MRRAVANFDSAPVSAAGTSPAASRTWSASRSTPSTSTPAWATAPSPARNCHAARRVSPTSAACRASFSRAPANTSRSLASSTYPVTDPVAEGAYRSRSAASVRCAAVVRAASSRNRSSATSSAARTPSSSPVRPRNRSSASASASSRRPASAQRPITPTSAWRRAPASSGTPSSYRRQIANAADNSVSAARSACVNGSVRCSPNRSRTKDSSSRLVRTQSSASRSAARAWRSESAGVGTGGCAETIPGVVRVRARRVRRR